MQRQLELEVAAELANVDWEAAALEEYTANQQNYEMPDQVSASHILISTEERSEEDAEALAREVLGKLRAGEDFATVAREFSEDGSVVGNSGDLGFFSRGQMVAPFEEAAIAMTESAPLSEPEKAQVAYHTMRFNEDRHATRST